MQYDLQNGDQQSQMLATIDPGGKDPARTAKLIELLEFVGVVKTGGRGFGDYPEMSM